MAIVAVTLAVAPPARADIPVTYTDEGQAIFHLSVPDFWEMRSGGVRIIDPDGDEPPARPIG